MALNLYNTRTKKIEHFVPIDENNVGLYTCGPTVYNYAHIGNLRTYVFEDILKRTLTYLGYSPRHVMNITDVGHLVSDADTGEDKMEKGSKREGKSAWEIAEFYTKAFQEDIYKLNILPPHIWCKATEHILEQINMVQKLLDTDYAYTTTDGIYFDTTKFPAYGEMANLKNQKLEAGARIEMGEKKNMHDFALWKFTPAGESRQMEWDAFGKKGFPGWHIECSAMALKYLGEYFDIHCGAIDHIPVHHTNEIAQSESFTGHSPWVNFWMHGEFLNIKSEGEVEKMAKSGENFLTLARITEKGYEPLAYRFYLLGSHYRTPINFSHEALDAATTAYNKLKSFVEKISEHEGTVNEKYKEWFVNAIEDDLNMPKALAVVWELVKDDLVAPGDKYATLLDFDKVLGLSLSSITKTEIPIEVEKLLVEREQARKEKDFAKSDELRNKILELGFEVLDNAEGYEVKKK